MNLVYQFSVNLAQINKSKTLPRVDSVDAVMAELTRRGIDAFVPAASYENVGRRVSFIQDPEGNVIEFAQDLE
ncbi:hypothetical protein [Chroococcidiopsis sp. CCMEE 29]|uniref:VOC family protein n=1 Tax=Chroococcidiopsis sp. CCMEE 29 TaxID=155894 RepID=UPI0020206FA7|nr:hypothetical protein [Chroococcidiopsis sp. CCMEE 29]